MSKRGIGIETGRYNNNNLKQSNERHANTMECKFQWANYKISGDKESHAGKSPIFLSRATSFAPPSKPVAAPSRSNSGILSTLRLLE